MEYPIASHTDALDLDQDDLALSAGGPMESDDYICLWEQCFKTYDDPEQLYMHMTNDHVGRKSTNNLCLTCHWEKCDYTTAKRDHITSHLRVHVPLKPFACEECNKPFKRRQDLKKHERTHTEEHQATLRNPHHRGFQPIRQMHPNTPPQGYSDRSPSLSSGMLTPSQVPLSPPHSLHSEGMHSDGTVPALSPYSETSDNFNANHQALELNADDFANLSYMANSGKRGYSDLDSTEDSYSSGSNDVLDELFTEVLRNKKLKPLYTQDMVNRLNNLSALAENGQLNAHINSEQDLNDLNRWLGQLETEITSGGGYLDPNILDGASSDSDLSSVDFPMPGVKSANGAGLYPNISLDGKPTNAALLGDFYNGGDMDVHVVYPQMGGDYNAAQYGLGAGADMYQLDPSGGLYPGQKQISRTGQPQVRNQYVRSKSRFTDRPIGAQGQLYDLDVNGTVLYNFDQQTQGGINYPVSGQYVGTTGVRRATGPTPQVAANFWGPTLQYTGNQTKANETKDDDLYKEFFRTPSPSADIKHDPDLGTKMESPDIKVKSEPGDEDDYARRLLSSRVEVKLEQDDLVPIKVESPLTVEEKKGMMTLLNFAMPPERNSSSPSATTTTDPVSQEATPTPTATVTPPGGHKFKAPRNSPQFAFMKAPAAVTQTPTSTPTTTPTLTVTASPTPSAPAATLSPDAASNSTRSRSASTSAVLNGTVRNADDAAAVIAQMMQKVSLDDNDAGAKARRPVPSPTPRPNSTDPSSSPYPSVAGATRPVQPAVGADVATRRKHAQLVQHILRAVNAVYRTKQLELMRAQSAVTKEEKDGWVIVDEVQRSVGQSVVVAGGDE